MNLIPLMLAATLTIANDDPRNPVVVTTDGSSTQSASILVTDNTSGILIKRGPGGVRATRGPTFYANATPVIIVEEGSLILSNNLAYVLGPDTQVTASSPLDTAASLVFYPAKVSTDSASGCLFPDTASEILYGRMTLNLADRRRFSLEKLSETQRRQWTYDVGSWVWTYTGGVSNLVDRTAYYAFTTNDAVITACLGGTGAGRDIVPHIEAIDVAAGRLATSAAPGFYYRTEESSDPAFGTDVTTKDAVQATGTCLDLVIAAPAASSAARFYRVSVSDTP